MGALFRYFIVHCLILFANPDSHQNYSLAENSKFVMNENSGEITTSESALDREEKDSYGILCKAEDSGGRAVNPKLQCFVRSSVFFLNVVYRRQHVIGCDIIRGQAKKLLTLVHINIHSSVHSSSYLTVNNRKISTYLCIS